MSDPIPFPWQEWEYEAFNRLQVQLLEQYEYAFPDPLAPKTVVVVPSMTLDADILAKIKGVIHYEERMLCILMLLRMPRTHGQEQQRSKQQRTATHGKPPVRSA